MRAHLDKEINPYKTFHDYLVISLFVFAVYYLINELIQLVSDGFKKYMTTIWNYIDLIPLILLIIYLVNDYIIDHSSY